MVRITSGSWLFRFPKRASTTQATVIAKACGVSKGITVAGANQTYGSLSVLHLVQRLCIGGLEERVRGKLEDEYLYLRKTHIVTSLTLSLSGIRHAKVECQLDIGHALGKKW